MAFVEDLSSFFDPDDFAEGCAVTGPDGFEKTIDVIFDPVTNEVVMFGETSVEASSPKFTCPESDVADVKRGMSATLRGQAYKVERIAVHEVAVATVYLSK